MKLKTWTSAVCSHQHKTTSALQRNINVVWSNLLMKYMSTFKIIFRPHWETKCNILTAEVHQCLCQIVLEIFLNLDTKHVTTVTILNNSCYFLSNATGNPLHIQICWLDHCCMRFHTISHRGNEIMKAQGHQHSARLLQFQMLYQFAFKHFSTVWSNQLPLPEIFWQTLLLNIANFLC